MPPLAVALLLAALLGPALSASQDQAPVQELPAFSRVQVCVPFNVLVSPPSAANVTYGLQVDAEPAVAQAVSARVAGDTLQLETSAPFSTNQPIKVVVYLPADRLVGLDHMGQLSTVYVSPGFQVGSFDLRLGSGSGSAYAFDLRAENLTVLAQGSGEVAVSGSFRTAEVVTSGISTVYVEGVSEAVTVDLSGISNVYLKPASADATIRGRASGISSVYHTQGQCAVRSSFLLSSACQRDASVELVAPEPEWTQGLTAAGTGFSCALGSAFLSMPGRRGRLGMGPALPAFQGPSLLGPLTFQFPFELLQPSQPSQPTEPAQPQPTEPAQPAQPSQPAPSGTAATGALPAPAGVQQAEPAPAQPAPAPIAEPVVGGLQPDPYAFQIESPTGSQFQAGSVTPDSRTAQSAATGQRQASASSVAGPGGVQTTTSQDGSGPTTAGIVG